MEKRLSRWGIGPRTFVPSFIYTLAAWAATSAWPEVFLLPSLPDVVGTVGAVLTALGLLLWIVGAVTVMRAYDRDQLVTSGVFALVRHPVYAGWITLAFPGLALLHRSWPMLITPLIAYAIFRSLIHREDEYLEKRFGQAYLDYRRRVNEVIPIPRFWL
ncbi:MAG: isoprenylcysteine carboxylmethyltransferase family protein [Candidatus Solibacter sp.]|nr:isoprenylcysteine carboxylmethyltransferase family protein [Candidatus Solibacter sp.]